MSFKDLLKRIFPPPVHAFNREVARILDAVEQNRQETDALRELLLVQADGLKELRRQLDEEQKRRGQWETQIRDEWQTQRQAALDRVLEGQAKTLAALTETLEQSAAGLQKQADGLAEALAAGQEQMATRQQADALSKQTGELAEAFAAGREQMATRQQADTLNKQTEILAKQGELLAKTVERARSQAADSARHASEAVWAQIFNNTISESLWLKDKTFSPGRWAVGYPYLYVMYRVLNETRPKRILELGLGQSTRMIAQYAAAFQDVEHIVVENDKSWIRFFSENLPLSPRTQVLELDLEMRSYNGIQNIRVYKDFAQTLTNQKFDTILIDGPVGGDMHSFARIDILDIVPDCLNNSFIIMIDDCNRIPENSMSLELEKRIAKADIRYKRSRISGEKEFILLVSADMGFITSM